MRITFLYASAFNDVGIPIGVSYLISILRNKGHEVSLFETGFHDFSYNRFNINGEIGKPGQKIINDFKYFVKKNDPDLICVSSISLCLNFALKITESLENRPVTIFGGTGATVDYENLIKNEVVDYICVGFGEECLPELVESLKDKRGLEEVPNLIHKHNGEVIKNKFSQVIELGKLPLPDWSLFDKRHLRRGFRKETKTWGSFQLTRGCPFDCTYCTNTYYRKGLGMRIQRFPVEKIIEEIRILSKKYQLEIIRIFDECFGFANLEPYKKFAKLYKQTIALPTAIATRPEVITPEIIKILKDINCVSVSVGIETGDENQRKTMLNRSLSNHVIKRAFDLLHEAKIRASSYNIIGFPHDTREKIFETIKLNKICKPDFINITMLTPDPKTQLREYCLKHDLLETEAPVTYEEISVIKNDKLSKDELYGLFKAFKYYINLPEKFYPLIEKFEKSGEGEDSLREIAEGCKKCPVEK